MSFRQPAQVSIPSPTTEPGSHAQVLLGSARDSGSLLSSHMAVPIKQNGSNWALQRNGAIPSGNCILLEIILVGNLGEAPGDVSPRL